MKGSIASATNAHRLGANEAPPAIISSFLGKHVTQILDSLEKTNSGKLKIEVKHGYKLDIPRIPELFIDNTDRNRTSPFAFTGNRFEFRAIGSSANSAAAMLALNAAVAEQLKIFKKDVDVRVKKGEDKYTAIFDILCKYTKECKAIRFDGNGYSDEWKKEAKKRGLDCETSVPLIFDAYLSKSSIEMFESTGVMTKIELEARNEVKWETYTKKVQIEGRVLGDLAINHIIPVATRYQSVLIDNVSKVKKLFDAKESKNISATNMSIIKEIAEHITNIKILVDKMVDNRKTANRISNEREKAIAYHDSIASMFDEIRFHIDKLELTVDNEMWTLPKYRELLFIR